MSLSIANRVLLGFIAVVLLLAGLGAYALDRIGEVRDTTAIIVSRDLAVMRELAAIRDDEHELRAIRLRALSDVALAAAGRTSTAAVDGSVAWQGQFSKTESSLAQASSEAMELQAEAVTPERAAAWSTIGQRLADATAELGRLRDAASAELTAISTGNLDRAVAAEDGVEASRTNFLDLIAAAEDTLDQAVLLGQDRVTTVYNESQRSIIIGLVLAALLGLGIAYAIRQSIIRPLGDFMTFADRVGRGDLAGAAVTAGRDEFGRLGRNLNTMVDGLRQLARQSRDATEDLNAAAAEIRASTQEQAASVEEQLAAVQETAATVDEITHAGGQIGKRAQEVIAAAQATAQTSNGGIEAVEETTRAMDLIREQAEAVAENIVTLSERTQAIGEIITTVNDISERSHLLALNAAIEAAAAGESRRSFAVVAAELKLLADQAKEATQQVRSILGDIQRGINSSVMLTEEAVKRVTRGKERSDITQRTIEEITSRMQESVQTFQQIVASTNQQQLGIEQVMGALQNIRQAGQQTAAGTRQLDTAAANLSQLAQQLVVLADRYHL